MIWVFIAFTIAVASGALLAEILLPRQLSGLPRWLATFSLGTGIGLGVSSLTLFLNLVFIGPSPLNLFITDFVILGAIAGAFLYLRRPHLKEAASQGIITSEFSKLQLLLKLGFFSVLALALISFVSFVLRLPHGRWDAWVLWNTRARILFGAEERWRDAFSDLFVVLSRSPDYPLLLPLNVARGWKYVGFETTLVPIAIAFLFMTAILFMVWSSLSILRSRGQAFIAGLVLLSTPYFLRQSSALEADVPLMFFYLATLALLLLFESTKQRGVLILAGLAAGMAAWTKNEGLLFVCVATVALLSVNMKVYGWKESFRRVGAFVIGLAPALSLVLFFKFTVAPSSALVSQQDWFTIVGRMTDPSRYLEIARATLSSGYQLGDWFVHPLLLVLLYPICLGVRLTREELPGAITMMFIVALMFAGYLFTYLLTPYDLQWHLNTSLKRLMLQLWPSLVLLYFFITRTPEESLLRDETGPSLDNLKGASNYV